jgi:hypothetical protein
MGVAVGVAAGVSRGANGSREKEGGSRELHLVDCVINCCRLYGALLLS